MGRFRDAFARRGALARIEHRDLWLHPGSIWLRGWQRRIGVQGRGDDVAEDILSSWYGICAIFDTLKRLLGVPSFEGPVNHGWDHSAVSFKMLENRSLFPALLTTRRRHTTMLPKQLPAGLRMILFQSVSVGVGPVTHKTTLQIDTLFVRKTPVTSFKNTAFLRVFINIRIALSSFHRLAVL
jgi:hypothetical protein